MVAHIPLSDIFLMATPLHSQNFVDTAQGVLTNNRRLVTKNMWFNGSALSAQARRALENERVTVVAHETGWIHILFPEATIDPDAFKNFSTKLRRFLQTPLTPEILGNFVRHSSDMQACFQVRWRNFGVDRYIAIEKLLAYENSFPYRFNDDTRDRLMMEVAGEDFESRPLPGRIVLDDVEQLVKERHIDVRTDDGFRLLAEYVGCTSCPMARDFVERLRRFCWTEPRLPEPASKTFKRDQPPLGLDVSMERADVVARLESLRDTNELAHLAFYAYRDLNRTESEPFVRAALERCPVSLAGTAGPQRRRGRGGGALAGRRVDLRRRRPVWPNPTRCGTTAGATVWRRRSCSRTCSAERHPGTPLTLEVQPDSATLVGRRRQGDGQTATYRFASTKNLRAQTWDCTG